MRLVQGDEEGVLVRWYRVPADRPFVPYAHPFLSRNWDEKDLDYPLGEVTGAPRKWTNGQPPHQFTGAGLCGSQTVWENGGRPGVDPLFMVGADSDAPCCGQRVFQGTLRLKAKLVHTDRPRPWGLKIIPRAIQVPPATRGLSSLRFGLFATWAPPHPIGEQLLKIKLDTPAGPGIESDERPLALGLVAWQQAPSSTGRAFDLVPGIEASQPGRSQLAAQLRAKVKIQSKATAQQPVGVTCFNASYTTSFSIPVPSEALPGDWLYILGHIRAVGGSNPTLPTGWTSLNNSTGTFYRTFACRKQRVAGDPTSVTITQAFGTTVVACLFCLRGSTRVADTVFPRQITVATTPFNFTGLVTSGTPHITMGVLAINSNVSCTGPSGYTRTCHGATPGDTLVAVWKNEILTNSDPTYTYTPSANATGSVIHVAQQYSGGSWP